MSRTKKSKGKKIRYTHPTFNITLNEEQQLARQEISQNDIAIILGNAGSGKTLLACYIALELYKSEQVKKIVITRPTVSKEDIGHLPGTAEENLAPWMAPVFANMHQLLDKSVIDLMITEGTLEVVPVTHMRGRAQPLDADILTPNGYIKMRDINIGQEIIGGDGNFYKVNGIYPQGKQKLYKIEFSDNSHTFCTKEHLWLVKYIDSKKMSVTDTITIKNNLYNKYGVKKYKIPLVKPINFEKKDLPIPPYLLGALIGDGCMTNNLLSFSTNDIEIISILDKLIPESLELKKVKNNKYDYRISKRIQNNHIKNELIEKLKTLNLYGKKSIDKFIPKNYLFSSVDDRIDLLRGLMDTDGSIWLEKRWKIGRKNSVSHYYTISPQLKDDVIFLVQTLGGTVKVKKNDFVGIDSRGWKYNHPQYSLDIRMPKDINPFKLKRKADKFGGKEKPVRLITNVIEMDEQECQCISVDSIEHTYLTNDCIVTHNTFTNAAIIFDEFQNAENGITEMILARIGIDSKMFLCGDYNQIDLKPQMKKLSGVYMVEGMEKIEGVCRIELKSNHRHPILDRIMKFFEEKNKQYK